MPAYFNDDLHTLIYKFSKAVGQAQAGPVYDPDAEAYFADVLAGSGTVISDTEKQNISNFISSEKSLGRWGQALNYYTLQSSQNAGTALTGYGLKPTSPATLVGPTWTTNGLSLSGAGQYFSIPNDMSGMIVSDITFFCLGSLSGTTQVASWVCTDDAFIDTPQHLALVSNGSNLTQGFFPGISTATTNQSIPTAQTFPQVAATRATQITLSAENLSGSFIRNGDVAFTNVTPLPIVGTFQPINATWKCGDLGGYTGQVFNGIYSFLAVFPNSINTASLYSSFKSTIGQGLGLP